MKGRDTFTMAVIKELKQLFLQKDIADYNEQKSIRRTIREKGFYISDFSKYITDFTKKKHEFNRFYSSVHRWHYKNNI